LRPASGRATCLAARATGLCICLPASACPCVQSTVLWQPAAPAPVCPDWEDVMWQAVPQHACSPHHTSQQMHAPGSSLLRASACKHARVVLLLAGARYSSSRLPSVHFPARGSSSEDGSSSTQHSAAGPPPSRGTSKHQSMVRVCGWPRGWREGGCAQVLALSADGGLVGAEGWLRAGLASAEEGALSAERRQALLCRHGSTLHVQSGRPVRFHSFIAALTAYAFTASLQWLLLFFITSQACRQQRPR